MTEETRACPVHWCDQGGRPHTLHESTLGTWSGGVFSGDPRLVTAQLVVYGYTDEDVEAMLTVVDSASLEQVEAVLSWDNVLELGNALVDAASRLRPDATS